MEATSDIRKQNGKPYIDPHPKNRNIIQIEIKSKWSLKDHEQLNIILGEN